MDSGSTADFKLAHFLYTFLHLKWRKCLNLSDSVDVYVQEAHGRFYVSIPLDRGECLKSCLDLQGVKSKIIGDTLIVEFTDHIEAGQWLYRNGFRPCFPTEDCSCHKRGLP